MYYFKCFFIIVFILLAQLSFSQIPDVVAGATGSVTFVYRNNSENYPIVRTNNNRLWTLKNLGAQRVAESATDQLSYGDYFQWGRWDDGHQAFSSNYIDGNTLTNNNPIGLNGGNSNFMMDWWINGNTSSKWEADSPNNATASNGCDPCKAIGDEWRLPKPLEYLSMISAENILTPAAGFSSNLKLSFGGYREYDFTNTTLDIYGTFWTSAPGSSSGQGGYMHLYHNPSQPTSKPGVWYGFRRQAGLSIRCIRHCENKTTTIKDTICSGSKYYIGNKEFTTSGKYTEKLWAYYGCDSTVTVELFVTPPPSSTLDTAICANDTLVFNNIKFTAPVQYSFIVQKPDGCDSVSTLNLALAKNELNIGDDTTLCVGEELKIVIPSYFNKVLWNNGSTSFEMGITNEGEYSVGAEVCNQIIKDTIHVEFAVKKKVSLPNVFTPNNDGINDFLEIVYSEPNIDLRKFQFTIVNRWGNIIYQSNDKDLSWDGKINNQHASEGIYYYVIDIHNGCQSQEKGFFYIFR